MFTQNSAKGEKRGWGVVCHCWPSSGNACCLAVLRSTLSKELTNKIVGSKWRTPDMHTYFWAGAQNILMSIAHNFKNTLGFLFQSSESLYWPGRLPIIVKNTLGFLFQPPEPRYLLIWMCIILKILLAFSFSLLGLFIAHWSFLSY